MMESHSNQRLEQHSFSHESVRPWAAGRQSMLDWISNDGDDDSPSMSSNLTLLELHDRNDILSEVVPLVWESNQGRSDIEISDKVMALIDELAQNPNRRTSIQLYQIVFSDYYTHFGTWRQLDEKLAASRLLQSALVYQLFRFWLEEAPDSKAVDFALFVLTRTERKPLVGVLLELGRYHPFVSGVASAIHRQYDADEYLLIHLAAQYRGGMRLTVLSRLERVTRPENKKWLLTQGYDSGLYEGGLDYEPCAYYAAVYGDLLKRLKEPHVTPEQLVHYSRMLAIMSRAVGGASSWKTIEDYEHAPEAIRLLFAYIRRTGVASSVLRELSDILYVLTHTRDDDSDEATWEIQDIEPLRMEGRALFEPPWVEESEAGRWLYWERPEPTIDDLRAGELGDFHSILKEVSEADDNDAFSEIVDWAIDFLSLQEAPEVRNARKQELLGERMPGICKGGLAGLTDPNLSTIYGQILLQIVLELKDRKPMGAPLLLAGLNTDYPHLPKAAAAVLVSWPDEDVPEHARELARQVMDNANASDASG